MKTIIIFLAVLIALYAILRLAAIKYPRQVKRVLNLSCRGLFLLIAIVAYCFAVIIYFGYQFFIITKWKIIHILTEMRSISQLERTAKRRLKKFNRAPSFYGKKDLEYLENLCLLMQQNCNFVPERTQYPYCQMDDYHFLKAKKTIEEKYQYWSKALKKIEQQKNIKFMFNPHLSENAKYLNYSIK